MLDWLKDILGEAYTEEVDKKVSDAVGKGFVSKADYNAKNEAHKALEDQLSQRDKQLEELKKVDAQGLQAQIGQLQEENKAAKAAHEQQLADMQFGFALDSALGKARAKNTTAVRALLNLEELKLDGGSILGLDTQLEKLRSEADYLFDSDKTVPQFAGPTPGVPFTGKSPDAMTYTEMAAYLEANPSAQL